MKLTNAKDLVKRGLVAEGDDPLQVAADRLTADGVDVLHTIGGDDTNTTAADLAAYLAGNDYAPDRRRAAEDDRQRRDPDPAVARRLDRRRAGRPVRRRTSSASTTPASRMLIVHEVMGRNCGWLTAATAKAYREWLDTREWLPEIGLTREAWDVHAVYVPEAEFDLEAEATRLREVMDTRRQRQHLRVRGRRAGHASSPRWRRPAQEVPRDAFGHVRLDKINPGAWFAKQFAERLGAEKVMVQKSGYFSRSAAANADDLDLIQSMTDLAVDARCAASPG